MAQEKDLVITPREYDVARGVGYGKQNKAIAFELGIAENTVKSILVNIYRKTGFRNRTELAVWFRKHGEAE